MCMNAVRADHDCKWAICNKCKTQNDDEKERRIQGDFRKKRRLLRNSDNDTDRAQRSAMNDKYDNNMCQQTEDFKHLCRHDSISI